MINNYRPAGSPKPEKMKCPICNRRTGWEVDSYDADWVLKGEWWTTENHNYVCSRKCWLISNAQ